MCRPKLRYFVIFAMFDFILCIKEFTIFISSSQWHQQKQQEILYIDNTIWTLSKCLGSFFSAKFQQVLTLCGDTTKLIIIVKVLRSHKTSFCISHSHKSCRIRRKCTHFIWLKSNSLNRMKRKKPRVKTQKFTSVSNNVRLVCSPYLLLLLCFFLIF